MKHKLLPVTIAFCLTLSPALRADAPTVNIIAEEPQQTPYVFPDDDDTQTATTPETIQETPANTEEAAPAEVSQGSNSFKKAQKKKRVRNIIIAALAVTVAVVAMILVSSNNGSKS